MSYAKHRVIIHCIQAQARLQLGRPRLWIPSQCMHHMQACKAHQVRRQHQRERAHVCVVQEDEEEVRRQQRQRGRLPPSTSHTLNS